MPIYECRNSEFLLTDLANLEDRSEFRPKQSVNKKNQTKREFQNHRQAYGSSIMLPIAPSLTEPSRLGFTSSGRINFDSKGLSKCSLKTAKTMSFESNDVNEEFLQPEILILKNFYCDNILDPRKDDLGCNDSYNNNSVVSKEISKAEMHLEDDHSVATMASNLSSISALSMTSVFHNVQDNRRRFFSKIRYVVNNVKDSLDLELQAEQEKEIQSKCDKT